MSNCLQKISGILTIKLAQYARVDVLTAIGECMQSISMLVRASAVCGVFVLSAPLFGMPAFANAASQDVAIKNLNKLLLNTKSMTAGFSQTTKAGSRSSSFRGTMAVQRQNQFRWQTTSPAEQLIVANGGTLWVYDKDLNQATKQSTSTHLGDTPALLLSGDPAQIAKNFNVSQPNVAKNYYVLKPKSGSANFKELSMSFNGGKPVMMVLNDNLGQTTTIKFDNIVINAKIPSSQFVFTPPKGTDVINQ